MVLTNEVLMNQGIAFHWWKWKRIGISCRPPLTIQPIDSPLITDYVYFFWRGTGGEAWVCASKAAMTGRRLFFRNQSHIA